MDEMLGGEIEKKLGLFTGDGRSAFQEIIDGFPVLRVIEKHLDTYARTGKTGCAAHALRVDPHDLMELHLLFHRHTFQITRKIEVAQAVSSLRLEDSSP